MNPLNLVTGAIAHPVRTVGSGVALGAQTTARVIEWAAGQVLDHTPVRRSGAGTSVADSPVVRVAPAPAPVVDTEVPEETVPTVRSPAAKAAAKKSAAKKAPAKTAPARKATAKKATAKKAPSARAATLGPALDPDALESLEETEAQTGAQTVAQTGAQQPDTEPLLDPAVAKSVRSEAEVLSRAADPDKG